MTDLPVRSSDSLRPLRYAACVEGSSLLILLTIAVPLKHLFDYPAAVQVVGPLHGLAFLTYCWLAISVATSEKWKATKLLGAVALAFIPLGGFFAARFLWRRNHHSPALPRPEQSNGA
ncbi:DUF3817 domain-containing protein [Pseudomonas sp. L13]|uniref:DUF3817 domain-containing protein n=1 Tax=Pseudomonas sp. L13 TaxID=343985 RepID=UPI001ECDEA69|nr:DUF3817 domain-containing protein [Pseudomonas sp. L13]NCE89435.1 hypothetical protein [Pseudomonas sp. L13]